jgi:uncharacterized membrane protein SpoIIM required for sporulation
MTQEKQSKTGILGSKYWKVFLVIIAGLFTFGGPYAVYVLVNFLKIGFTYSIIPGFGLFIVGLVLIWYLIKNKVIS